MVTTPKISRRTFLTGSVAAFALNALPSPSRAAGADDFGPLLAPDANGLRLPKGFRSRIVAQTGQPILASGPTPAYVWHGDPDGGATFAAPDGGWVYVSNSEASTAGGGGVGAIRFDANGRIVDAYRVLSGTTRNCAGGRTPWKTWLSCEETPTGRVFECDPFARNSQGTARPALGVFQHEAVAVDPVGHRLYLTEDQTNGLLYRFTPTAWPDLSAGRLEAAQILDPNGLGAIAPGQTRPLAWHVVPDPQAMQSATRTQVPLATRFNGGEGIDYGGVAGSEAIWFTTKGDDRVWRLDPTTDRISIHYAHSASPTAPLSGVDNVLVTPTGDVYVAEDGGDLQIVALTASGLVVPILQVVGAPASEITGPALSPDGRRLYFSSQRQPGTTYEVEGPFLGPAASALGGISQVALVSALGSAALRALGGSSA